MQHLPPRHTPSSGPIGPDLPGDPPAAEPDPILAVATAAGRGAVGIVRLSSARPLDDFIRALCGRPLAARRAELVTVRDARGLPIDQVVALWFAAPHSATGESVLELQGHGGTAVLQGLVERCLDVARHPDAAGHDALPRLRLARPGEFSERAFLNGKLDLAQAEAVADLIDADSAAAARGAARSLSGEFSQAVRRIADGLELLRLLVEATLDFPEEDLDFVREHEVTERVARLREDLAALRARARQGVLLREGLQVVLAGIPNAGKSSLLNALAGEELAIVTPIAGTTRDRIRQTVVVDGVPLHLVDTAGLRPTDDPVERLGVERSRQAIRDADVVLWLHDLTRPDDPSNAEAAADLARELSREPALTPTTDGAPAGVPDRPGPARVLQVFNKADGLDAAQRDAATATIRAAIDPMFGCMPDTVTISALTAEGLETLRAMLLQRAGWQSDTEGVFAARRRHLEALSAAAQHLESAGQHLGEVMPPLDLLAEDLRLAHRSLGEITGQFTTEDLLGAIFSRFCIGK